MPEAPADIIYYGEGHPHRFDPHFKHKVLRYSDRPHAKTETSKGVDISHFFSTAHAASEGAGDVQAVYNANHPGHQKITRDMQPGADYVGYLTRRALSHPQKYDAQLADAFPIVTIQTQSQEPIVRCVVYDDKQVYGEKEYISLLGVGTLSKNDKGEFVRTAFAIRFKPEATEQVNKFLSALRQNPQDTLTHAFDSIFKKNGVPQKSLRPSIAADHVTPGPIEPALKMQFRDLRVPK